MGKLIRCLLRQVWVDSPVGSRIWSHKDQTKTLHRSTCQWGEMSESNELCISIGTRCMKSHTGILNPTVWVWVKTFTVYIKQTMIKPLWHTCHSNVKDVLLSYQHAFLCPAGCSHSRHIQVDHLAPCEWTLMISMHIPSQERTRWWRDNSYLWIVPVNVYISYIYPSQNDSAWLILQFC